MRFVIWCFLMLIGSVCADPSLTLEVPKKEAWTGERLSFYIELRAPGSFKGAPNFDLPRIERSVILKVGTPTLGSITENGQEFLTQRHEFALFSQASGEIELPPIKARFRHLKGYTGPAFDASLETSAAKLKINRPPESDALGFLVTTDSMEIEEKWDPQPGELKTGDVIKRTIVQKASKNKNRLCCVDLIGSPVELWCQNTSTRSGPDVELRPLSL